MLFFLHVFYKISAPAPQQAAASSSAAAAAAADEESDDEPVDGDEDVPELPEEEDPVCF